MAMREHDEPRRRALVLMASGKWMGWLCERCSWSCPLPATERERADLARRIQQLFDEHCCEEVFKAPRTNA